MNSAQLPRDADWQNPKKTIRESDSVRPPRSPSSVPGRWISIIFDFLSFLESSELALYALMVFWSF